MDREGLETVQVSRLSNAQDDKKRRAYASHYKQRKLAVLYSWAGVDFIDKLKCSSIYKAERYESRQFYC